MLFVGDYRCFIFQERNAWNLRKHDFQLEQFQNMFLESYRKCLQHGCRVDAFKTRHGGHTCFMSEREKKVVLHCYLRNTTTWEISAIWLA